jgi:predicted dehydrogenase
MKSPLPPNPSRRRFVRLSALSTGAAALGGLGSQRVLGATAGSDRIRVGLVGCGGRGKKAAQNCLDSSPGVQIVAVADLFQHQVEVAQKMFNINSRNCFWGFDAYENLLATDVNLVIFATPPGFRPQHFAAAVAAGKNVFLEKPVAVDPVGCRSVMTTARLAREKGLAVGAGTQRRHQPAYIETMKRIIGGQIGELVGGQCYWNGQGIWFREKKDWVAGFSDFEWQCWNWYHWDWLSGDQIVEQHIHNLDVMNWAFGGPPVKFLGMGGRQNRGSIPGNIWDHFAVELEYANGARVTSMCRHTPKSATRIGERVVGTRGTSTCDGDIKGENPYHYDGENPNPQVQEHTDLVRSIRAGLPLNDGERVAASTLTAIGGRMSAYTGREISWNWLLSASQLEIFPRKYGPGPGHYPPVPVPGSVELV